MSETNHLFQLQLFHNEIPDTKTTIEDIYGVENLRKIDINNISTLTDVKEIFKYHKWNKGLFPLSNMRLKNIDEYKKIIMDRIKE